MAFCEFDSTSHLSPEEKLTLMLEESQSSAAEMAKELGLDDFGPEETMGFLVEAIRTATPYQLAEIFRASNNQLLHELAETLPTEEEVAEGLIF